MFRFNIFGRNAKPNDEKFEPLLQNILVESFDSKESKNVELTVPKPSEANKSDEIAGLLTKGTWNIVLSCLEIKDLEKMSCVSRQVVQDYIKDDAIVDALTTGDYKLALNNRIIKLNSKINAIDHVVGNRASLLLRRHKLKGYGIRTLISLLPNAITIPVGLQYPVELDAAFERPASDALLMTAGLVSTAIIAFCFYVCRCETEYHDEVVRMIKSELFVDAFNNDWQNDIKKLLGISIQSLTVTQVIKNLIQARDNQVNFLQKMDALQQKLDAQNTAAERKTEQLKEVEPSIRLSV